jgi:2'-5' RNA ligase
VLFANERSPEMTAKYHSIWLMPRPEDEETFAAIVRSLAKRFTSPVFQPHLTLVEDMPRTLEELEPLLKSLTEGMASLSASVEAVEESPLYYRSLYARFPVAVPLKTLKQRAVDLFKIGSLETFMPHISLGYGVPESSEKTEAVAALRDDLQGMTVTFDRACIVSSSQHTPIEDWAIRHSSRLQA